MIWPVCGYEKDPFLISNVMFLVRKLSRNMTAKGSDASALTPAKMAEPVDRPPPAAAATITGHSGHGQNELTGMTANDAVRATARSKGDCIFFYEFKIWGFFSSIFHSLTLREHNRDKSKKGNVSPKRVSNFRYSFLLTNIKQIHHACEFQVNYDAVIAYLCRKG